MAKMHVKHDDVVVVISGADKGRQGTVLTVDRKKNRVIVEGINRRKHAVRRSQDNPRGGIEEREQPIHISNVMALAKYDASGRSRPEIVDAAAEETVGESEPSEAVNESETSEPADESETSEETAADEPNEDKKDG